MAAAGLPEARKDHAEIMARFANECRAKMMSLVKELEVELGPDTGTCFASVNESGYIPVVAM